MNRRRSSTLIGLAALALLFAGTARADLHIGLSSLINGSTPTGVTPWLDAVFHTNTAGDVTLTMSNLMPAAEITDDWMFNVLVNGGLDATSLVAHYVSGPAYTLTQRSSQSDNGGSNMKAGLFNLHFAWTTANNANRFSGGRTVVMEFTGGGITEDSFDVLSAVDTRYGITTAVSAAHIQGIPPSTSGSVRGDVVPPVPEPGSILLFLGAAAGLAPAIRRRFAR
ncbi:MAG: PEP-CTERM sorting domain-containing protein [Acidobacteriota bacterium]|nr:PEP-CTERM sorting domain-containing protein [Acidobacteriota bacterium]